MKKYLLLIALLTSGTVHASECLNCTPNQDINNDYNRSEINNSNNATSAPTSIMTNIQNNPASVSNSSIGGISCAPEFLVHGGVGVGRTEAHPSDYRSTSETGNLGFVWNPAAKNCLESQKSLIAYKYRENNRKSVLEDIQFCHWLSTNGIKISGGFLETYEPEARKQIKQQIVRCKSIVMQPKNNFVKAPVQAQRKVADLKAFAKVEKKKYKKVKTKGKWKYKVQVATLVDGWCDDCGEDDITKQLKAKGFNNILYKRGKRDTNPIIISLGEYATRQEARDALKAVRDALKCDAFIKRRWQADK